MRSIAVIGTLVTLLVLGSCRYGPFSSQDNPFDDVNPVTPNDVFYSADQWYLPLVGAPEAWGLVADRSVSPSILAVIDKQPGGLHEDLDGVYTNDGIDFTGGSAEPLVFPEPGTLTPPDHGNHVTGIAAATSENGVGIAGIAYNRLSAPIVRIMPLAMLDAGGFGTVADLAAAMLYAAGLDSGRGVFPDTRADVINMSLGAQTLGPIEEALLASVVEIISAQGVLMVAAAGNDGGNAIDFPAAFADVIAVGAVDQNRVRASFSDTGPELDLVAPGEAILSTINESDYQLLEGTSMASPLVAGSLAVLRAVAPAMSAQTMRTLLETTAVDLGAAGFDDTYGHGLLDMHAMLSGALVVSPYGGSLDRASSHTLAAATLRDIAARATNGSGAIKIAGSELLVLFDPERTGLWQDQETELSDLANAAGISWTSRFTTDAPVYAEASLAPGQNAETARDVLLADPTVLLVSGNRRVFR